MPAGRAGGTPTRNPNARERDHSMFARLVRAAAKLRPAQHFRWRNDARALGAAVEIPASFRRSPETQFRHDLSLMTPSGIERLSDNRDHPLCLSQGRSTRSCSGAPQKHPSPADARSKIEGVALPPIDAFTRRAERRGSTPSPGPAAPPNFFVRRSACEAVTLAGRQQVRTIAISCLLGRDPGRGAASYGWHRLDRGRVPCQIALHAPARYYFATLPRRRGGTISAEGRDRERGRSGHAAIYVIGTYDEQGRLIAIEKRSGGEQIFRVDVRLRRRWQNLRSAALRGTAY